VGKRILNFWPGDSVAGNAVMELGLWLADPNASQNVRASPAPIHPHEQTHVPTSCYLRRVSTVLRESRMAGGVMVRVATRSRSTWRTCCTTGTDPLLIPRDIAETYESRFWQSQFEPPPVGLSSLTPHYAGLKAGHGARGALSSLDAECGSRRVTGTHWVRTMADQPRRSRENSSRVPHLPPLRAAGTGDSDTLSL
jgi:hypothetical protein